MKKKIKNIFNLNLISTTIILLSVILAAFLSVSYLFSQFSVKKTLYYEKLANNLRGACRSQRKDECYRRGLVEIINRDSFYTSYQVLTNLQQLDKKMKYCHGTAHQMAFVAVKKDSGHPFKILENIDPNSCAFGFFHGAVESFTRLHPEFYLSSESIPKLCNVVSPYLKYMGAENKDELCGHIIGHVLLVQEFGDIQKAVYVCSETRLDLRRGCYWGVFMENNSRDGLEFHGVEKKIPWNYENTLLLEKECFQVSGEKRTACWRAIPYVYVNSTLGNYTQMYSLCSHAYEAFNQETCYLSGAGIIATLGVVDSIVVENLSGLCSPFKGDIKIHNCIKTMVETVVLSAPAAASRLLDFCERLNSAQRRYCYNALSTSLNFYKDLIEIKERQKICDGLPASVKNSCNVPIFGARSIFFAVKR